MHETNPFRTEMEQILLTHQRTRYAKVLNGIKRGLDDAEISKEAHEAGEPIKAEGVANVRRILRLTLDDELVPAPSDAEDQSYLYREMLNYDHSPELHKLVMTRLSELQAIEPSVKLTPLGNVYLGGGRQRRPDKLAPLCSQCGTHHPGEC